MTSHVPRRLRAARGPRFSRGLGRRLALASLAALFAPAPPAGAQESPLPVLVYSGLSAAGTQALREALDPTGFEVRQANDEALQEALRDARRPLLAAGYPVSLLELAADRGLLARLEIADASAAARAAAFGHRLDDPRGAYRARWLDPFLLVASGELRPPPSLRELGEAPLQGRVVLDQETAWSCSRMLLAWLRAWGEDDLAAAVRANRHGAGAGGAGGVLERVLHVPGAIGIVPRRVLHEVPPGRFHLGLAWLPPREGEAPRVAFQVLGVAAGFGVTPAAIAAVEADAVARLVAAAEGSILVPSGDGGAGEAGGGSGARDPVGLLMGLASRPVAGVALSLADLPREWESAWREGALRALRDEPRERAPAGGSEDVGGLEYRLSETFDVVVILAMAVGAGWWLRRRNLAAVKKRQPL